MGHLGEAGEHDAKKSPAGSLGTLPLAANPDYDARRFSPCPEPSSSSRCWELPPCNGFFLEGATVPVGFCCCCWFRRSLSVSFPMNCSYRQLLSPAQLRFVRRSETLVARSKATGSLSAMRFFPA